LGGAFVSAERDRAAHRRAPVPAAQPGACAPPATPPPRCAATPVSHATHNTHKPPSPMMHITDDAHTQLSSTQAIASSAAAVFALCSHCPGGRRCAGRHTLAPAVGEITAHIENRDHWLVRGNREHGASVRRVGRTASRAHAIQLKYARTSDWCRSRLAMCAAIRSFSRWETCHATEYTPHTHSGAAAALHNWTTSVGGRHMGSHTTQCRKSTCHVWKTRCCRLWISRLRNCTASLSLRCVAA
jgi:hypothetical protein